MEYGTVKAVGAQKRKADSESDEGSGQAASTGRVQCCVKAKSWGLTLGGTGGVDFRACEISCFLLIADSEKIVETRANALDFSVKPSSNGVSAQVEVKISVLSSQFEGALFKLRFDCVTKAKDRLTCFSEPIKVVSKKSQLEKEDSSKKRTRTTQVATREAVLEMLEKIEDRDAEMLKQFAAINAAVNKLSKNAHMNNNNVINAEETPRSPTKALDAALDLIATLPPAARQAVTHNLSPQKLALLHEIAGAIFPEPPPLNTSANNFDFRTASLNNMGTLFDM